VTALTAIAPHSGRVRGRLPVRARSLGEFIEAAGLRSLVLGSSKDPNAKVTVLLVSPITASPIFAVKVPTTDVAAQAVQAEAKLLLELQPILGDIDGTIPRVVELVEHRGRTALVTTALPGTPLSRLYVDRGHTASSTRVAADFAAVGRWLQRFQQATIAVGEEAAADTSVCDRIATRFADEPAVEEDLARLAAVAARVSEPAAGRTAVHGDFWFGNVLIEHGLVAGIVDWEAGALQADPTRDVVRFALGYALYLDRRTRAGRRVRGHRGLVAGRWGAAAEFAVEGTGWFPELFRRFVQEGLARAGAPAAAWRDYVLVGIAEVAATADDREFATRHLELFRRLVRREVWRAPE
jgi:aminoglycoside phosphotransferase (APT) family kinase protein